MSKQKKRWEKSRRFSGAILISVFLSILVGADRGWTVTASSTPASGPGNSVKTAQGVVPIHYAYHPNGKPDPFQPFVEKEISLKKRRTIKKVKPLSIFPLQRAGLGEFKLIGIAGNEQERTAMVTDVRGKFFPLVVGTMIGLNGGRVVRILEDRVIVEEKAAAGKGQYKTRCISLKLPRVD